MSGLYGSGQRGKRRAEQQRIELVRAALRRHLTVPAEQPHDRPGGVATPGDTATGPLSAPDRSESGADAAVSGHTESVQAARPSTLVPLEAYPEQIAGARAMLRGAVVEMATGEGKTVTAAFTAAVWAMAGPVHVATANDYLTARDAAWLAPVYQEAGLTVGVVTPGLRPNERRDQYQRDIVYSTLSEFGFDYLRDQLVTRPRDRVQSRGLGALIVDEADLLLIDEARTPLIIARPRDGDDAPDLAGMLPLVRDLVAEQVRRVTAKLNQLGGLPPSGFDTAVVAAQLRRGAPRDPEVLAYFRSRPEAVRAAERADRELRGRHGWMLDDGLIYSIDESGRTAYFTADGQAMIEAELGPLFAEPATSGETLAALHNLILAYALFLRDRDYLVRDGRVVLIEEATGRAAESRRYMNGLHAAIEAKELGAPLQETETLAQISVQQFVRQYARRAGMTGTAVAAAGELARIYEMDVVRIPRHRPNRRVDLPPRLYRTAEAVDQAVLATVTAAHQAGQPVLAGTASVGRSDRVSALLTAAGLPHAVLNAREHAREAEVIAGAGRAGAITIATNMAGRGTDIRLQHGPADGAPAPAQSGESGGPGSANPPSSAGPSPRGERGSEPGDSASVNPAQPAPAGGAVPDSALPATAGAGAAPAGTALGLLVIATEPQASRRLDQQLRGRSGRQGDPGLTRLFASLEDETLRFYGSAPRRARAARLLEQPPYLEGAEARRVIEDAQRRAEGQHAAQRRVLFEFDQIIERQRRAMLAGRERVLTAPDIAESLRTLIPLVAAAEVARRPAGPAALDPWWRELRGRYRLPGPDPAVAPEGDTWEAEAEGWDKGTAYRSSSRKPGMPPGRPPGKSPGSEPIAGPGAGSVAGGAISSGAAREQRGAKSDCSVGSAETRVPGVGDASGALGHTGEMVANLTSALTERELKARAESGRWWPGLVRAALLRSIDELWARHVEMIDHLQRQAPSLFAFLPTPAVVKFAHEAAARYADYVTAVRAESLAALLTLPQPHERALPPSDSRPLGEEVQQLVRLIDQRETAAAGNS